MQRLKFIRHARELGFGIEEIRELLQLSDKPDTSCAAADAIARTHLEQVEIRLTKLRALRKELKRMVEECGHGHVSQCRVIEVLAIIVIAQAITSENDLGDRMDINLRLAAGSVAIATLVLAISMPPFI